MGERETFLTALEANPEDETTRLVFADWLDEHDEPEEANRMRAWPEANRRIQAIADDIAADVDGMNARTLLEIAAGMVEHANTEGRMSRGESFSTGPRQVDSPFEYGDYTAEQFWIDWSIITGRPIPDGVQDKELGWAKPVAYYCAC